MYPFEKPKELTDQLLSRLSLAWKLILSDRLDIEHFETLSRIDAVGLLFWGQKCWEDSKAHWRAEAEKWPERLTMQTAIGPCEARTRDPEKDGIGGDITYRTLLQRKGRLELSEIILKLKSSDGAVGVGYILEGGGSRWPLDRRLFLKDTPSLEELGHRITNLPDSGSWRGDPKGSISGAYGLAALPKPGVESKRKPDDPNPSMTLIQAYWHFCPVQGNKDLTTFIAWYSRLICRQHPSDTCSADTQLEWLLRYSNGNIIVSELEDTSIVDEYKKVAKDLVEFAKSRCTRSLPGVAKMLSWETVEIDTKAGRAEYR